jgi:hypothetical protein
LLPSHHTSAIQAATAPQAAMIFTRWREESGDVDPGPGRTCGP